MSLTQGASLGLTPAKYIRNRGILLQSGDAVLRRYALDIAEAGIAAADPGTAARRAVNFFGNALHIADREYRLSPEQRIFVIGAGKATYPIAQVLDDVLGSRIHKGLIVCKRGQLGSLNHIDMLLADHPVPTAASWDAAERTVSLLREVQAGDIVIACFTGGSSSLFVSPAEGISLEDKAETNRVLLGCGANIIEVNAVRKHISKVKGGRLVRDLPAGTQLVNLTVSDVIGERLEYITCPSVHDTSSFEDACATLDKYDLWNRVPFSVVRHLRKQSAAERSTTSADLAHIVRQDELIVTTDAACAGAADAARNAGFHPIILSTLFEGESSSLGKTFAAIAREILATGRPLPMPCVLIGGGETTVTISSKAGLGGPNQEFAVAAALELDGYENVVALGIDTDGTDGPTPHAGGLVDGSTAGTMRLQGFDLHIALRDHDVTNLLERTGHIITTGNTGTNVNDLKMVLVGRPPQD
ncbi:DUF4147 domain-containing protein [Agrobacterium rhizogenes]|nr:DUF4147 domain-containing protein [Rhizobium rhizogenes]OCJ22106.1 glycerate kinase [Agrobacterium sp. B131/95]OCJ24435.1 glycerate kinase [Agrobacterium sp. B133/95]NTI52987.1 DUF4147 domain-containing protein [Rhizobium rhizogenes]NTI98360.1 DUF4147 domain-containing protein [Rhizobium rhizogenes]